jgi:uncharacterized membrane protein
MRRNPLLIDLIDKPMRTRPSFCSHHRTSSGDGVIRVCVCALILVMTVACFWIYDLIAHRGPSYAAPLRAHVVETRRDRHSTPAAIAPDMNSDAVRFANADVAAEPQRSELKPESPKAKHAAAPPRKKKTQMVARRRLPDPAMQTFAWTPRTFHAPFGRY